MEMQSDVFRDAKKGHNGILKLKMDASPPVDLEEYKS